MWEIHSCNLPSASTLGTDKEVRKAGPRLVERGDFLCHQLEANGSSKLLMFQTSRALRACAFEHSRDMDLENFFSHETPNDLTKHTVWQRMEAKGQKSGERAENIALRTSQAAYNPKADMHCCDVSRQAEATRASGV